MLTVQLNKINNVNCNSRQFIIKEMVELKKRLNKKKNELNEPYKTERYRILSKLPSLGKLSSKIKYTYARKYNAINITNAWLKIYEIIDHYKLIPKNGLFRYFDNASFPGSFILAINHYINTNTSSKLEWYGSSYIGGGELEDQYNLYKNYPDRWTMSKTNNGDVRDINIILDIVKQTNKKFDLYTSDLGINVEDVKLKYNRSGWDYQEELHANANLGQVLTGLLLLKKSGNMVIKMYSFFTSRSISLLGMLTVLFKKVEISKPVFSAIRSTEIYIICLDYKGESYFKNTDLYDKIVSRLDDDYDNLKPIITRGCITESFITDMIEHQTMLTERQIRSINEKLDVFYGRLNVKDIPYIKMPSFIHRIKKISKKNLLNVKNIYR